MLLRYVLVIIWQVLDIPQQLKLRALHITGSPAAPASLDPASAGTLLTCVAVQYAVRGCVLHTPC
jgi:hypothetical protein